jgi:hypothetical protein
VDASLQSLQLGGRVLERDGDDADARERGFELPLTRLGVMTEAECHPARVRPVDPDLLETRLRQRPGAQLLGGLLVADVDRRVAIGVGGGGAFRQRRAEWE